MQVTPLHHLVKNIDSFIAVANEPEKIKIVTKRNGRTSTNEFMCNNESFVMTALHRSHPNNAQ